MGLPEPDIDAVAAACSLVREAVRAGRVAAAHDISDGGLACALAECAIAGEVGCRVDLSPLLERGCSPEEALFGEGCGGFVVTGAGADLEALAGGEAPVVLIGEVGGEQISITAADSELSVAVEDATRAWSSLSDRLG